MQVDGTQTTINSTSLTVDDLNITLASGAANSAAANGAGITVDGASATLLYASSDDSWAVNKRFKASSDIRLGSEGVRLSSDGNGEFGVGYGQTATNQRFTVYNDTTVAFRVKPDGKVGIGTSNPTAKLQISHNGGHTSGDVALENSSLDLYNPLEANTDEKGSILTFSDNYLSGSGYVRTTRAAIKGGTDTVGNSADGFLAFYTDAVGANTMPERMRIDHDGNVGIGASPHSFSKLLVKATTDQHVGIFTNSSGLTIGGLTDNGGSAALRIAGSPLHLTGQGGGAGSGPDIAIISGGNVGIGTATPDALLDIEKAASGTSFISHLQLGQTGTVADSKYGIDFKNTTHGWNQGRISLERQGSASNFDMVLSSAGAGSLVEGIRIDHTGNVGIGINAPSETLELTRLGKIGFGMNGNYGARIGYFDDGGGVHGLHVDTKHAGTTVSESRFVVRADSGNVGIGTKNPSQIFHVQKAADDKLVYGSNPRLLLDTPTGINGLRVLGDTTPFEFKIDSGTYNGSTFQMGGTGDLSFIGTTTTASDTFNDSPTFFFNSQRWNGSANSTHFQGAIKGHTRSATNGDGYLGIGANASANQLNIDASTGNVGIGTTTPGSELSVVNTGDVKVEIKSTGTGDADAILMLDSADGGESEIRFKHDGVLGAKIQWFTDGSPDLNIMTESGTDGVIDFQPNLTLAMRIQPGGTIVTGDHAVFSGTLSSGANTVKITTPQTLSGGNHWDQFTAIFTMTGVDGGLSGNTFTQWRQTWTGLNTWGGGAPAAIIGSAPSVTHATVSADYVQFDIATGYIPGNTMLRVEVLSHAMRTDCTVTIT